MRRTGRNLRRLVVAACLGLVVFGLYRLTGMAATGPNPEPNVVYVDTGLKAPYPSTPAP